MANGKWQRPKADLIIKTSFNYLQKQLALKIVSSPVKVRA